MYTIGRLSDLTGLPVKTIRFYSDTGVLPERERTAAGYRLYEDEDRVRLEAIRALREIGVDLATIKALGDRNLREVLALHLRTVETQIKSLQRTRTVLRAILDHDDPTDEDLHRLNALGRMGAAEVAALVEDFVDDVTAGNQAAREWMRCLRAAMVPDLPDEPTVAQLDAWLELTALLSDDDFRARLRDQSAAFWSQSDDLNPTTWQAANARIMEYALAALDAGIPPDSPAAAPVLEQILTTLAETYHVPLDAAFRKGMRDNYDQHDQRAERYWELIATIQDAPWPPKETLAHRWIGAALRHHDHAER
ncbi:DNA-binding transcriptional MerR regulator [Thermocatellispora tengchongensis]|uniref:DNA-binding transcriptional MerR regulator n=1 Tax=Thermocatellispora tengchongensis TaxID=1073253 RepID=A0A840P425_9ACTN|nr:MerR family transcriptional regulator [Thermocatellispora tengchongensis]MBB5130795.1 DNA-binding transcriptional MerR regulator [Thermocatellispora tengchongensis]